MTYRTSHNSLNGFGLRTRNAPVNGPILMQKAEEISKQLGHNEFTASEGWFYRWKKLVFELH